jgi:5-methylcytosine-specific restriction enzyme subunit McrC
MSDQLRYIQVFEHETITTYQKKNGRFITSSQFEQLCAYNDQNGNKYFTVVRNGVKFKHYVGVIQVGRTTIEILPKTDNSETKVWHNILLQMLAECKKVKRESVADAVLRKRENSLLDIYIEMFLDEVEQLVHKGLVKKYKRDKNQTKALKGKLLFADHIRKNLVHKERFFTEHTIYTSDNIYNQIVKRGLSVISKLHCASYLKDRAVGLDVYFHSISNLPIITDKTFDRLPLSRNSQKYKEAISIARLIILNYSPDIKNGSENLLAILFNMNDLWQEYILLQLKKNTP